MAISGDLLLTVKGSGVGKTNYVDIPELAISRQLMAIRCIGMERCYSRMWLKAKYDEFQALKLGIAIPGISRKDVRSFCFPLPPLKEQKRIVAKVDELMALCDELEAKQLKVRTKQIAFNRASLHALTEPNETSLAPAWHRVRDHFDHLYTSPETVSELRQTILQLAVMGRLVPQDPNDEPASEFLKRIQAEKRRLTAEGVIRSPKPLPPIKPDEELYGPPLQWSWTRLGSVGLAQTGTTPKTSSPRFFGEGYSFIKPADISPSSEVCFDGEQLTEEGIQNGRRIARGSALMVCIGGSIGKVGYTDRECSCNQQINALTPLAGVVGRFLAYLMRSKTIQEQVLSTASKTTIPILSKGKWERLVIPLPPLAEQKRIVAKVDELMTLCDNLEAELRQSQIDADNLLTAIVHELTESSAAKVAR